ncbi:MAG: flagellar basal body rod protein FlgB [Bdellovibrionales bacterium]|nr:flagellar basal body rod protein FlgB [Bdellovibrionales bacterium]
MADSIFDPTMGSLNTSMNLRLAQQNVISSNIANADTPGFKAKAMEFESAFREALGAGDLLPMSATEDGHVVPRETDPIYPEIYDDPNGVESLDGNTVNRSAEMTKLAENQLMYDASAELVRRKLGLLKYSITEGGGNR